MARQVIARDNADAAARHFVSLTLYDERERKKGTFFVNLFVLICKFSG